MAKLRTQQVSNFNCSSITASNGNSYTSQYTTSGTISYSSPFYSNLLSLTPPSIGTYRVSYNGQYGCTGENMSLRASNDLSNLMSTLASYSQTGTHALGYVTETVTPGVYAISGAATQSGTLTFDAQGVSTALFIIRISGAFASAANSTMVLVNGALATNIFWVVGGAPTTGANSTFLGNVVCNTAISMGDTTVATGRFFSTAGAIASTNLTLNVPPGNCAINLYSLANIVLFSRAGALANTGTNAGTGDIGTYAGAITNYSNLFGNQFPTPNPNSRALFYLNYNGGTLVPNSTRIKEVQVNAFTQIVTLEALVTITAVTAISAVIEVDAGTFYMGNQTLTIERVY